jgi:signal transduction histidine kinase
LEELHRLTRGAQAEMRTLLLELRPSGLIQAPLGDLIKQLVTAMSGRNRLPVQMRITGDRCLVPDVQIALYRITQEALNNIMKHAQASQVDIELSCGEEHAELRIADNGRGFDLQRFSADHMGLRNMSERAQSIGAEFSIESRAGQGTQVHVVWSKATQDA